MYITLLTLQMKLIFTASYDVYKHFYSSLGARKYSAELTYAQFLSNNSLTGCLWVVCRDVMLNSKQAVRMITRYAPSVVLAL